MVDAGAFDVDRLDEGEGVRVDEVQALVPLGDDDRECSLRRE
jgi:hypothetical protein